MSWLFVFLGGGLGSISRYGIGLLLPSQLSYVGTLIANLLACALLGLILGLHARDLLSSSNKLLLATGFCGGFSTFSTFNGELVLMGQADQWVQAIAYGLLSMVLGIVCLLMGLWCAKLLSSS